MKKLLRLSAVLLLCTWAIELQWRRGQSLTALLVIWALGLVAITWLSRFNAVVATTVPATQLSKPPKAAPWFAGLFGLLAATLACSSFLKLELDLTLVWLLAAAILLRKQWQDDDEPIPYLNEGLLLLIILGGATWFRFSHLGKIPIASSIPDEALLKLKAHFYLNGVRETFAMGPGSIQDGAVPFYLEALSMKLFGHDLQGFRTLIAMIGVLLCYLIYGIGKDLLGRRVGLLAAAFTAFSLWTLGISQVNYLMNESLLFVLLCFYATLVGLRRQSAAWLALAGFCFGISFNTYKAMQLVLALLPYLLLLLYVYEPQRRESVKKSLAPLLAGAFLGLVPLLLWAYWGGDIAYKAYFSSLSAPHIVGVGAVQSTLLGKMNFLFGRAIDYFPKMLTLFISHGPTLAATFSATVPLASPALVLFVLIGLAAGLARGRRAGSLFLILWFFYGFLPALVAEPTSIPNDRRAIMALPAMLLLAGQGLAAALSILSRVGGRARGALLSLCLLGFFGYYAQDNWNLWFVQTNQNQDYLSFNRVNNSAVFRVINQVNQKTPLIVLQTHLPRKAGFFDSTFDPNQTEYDGITGGEIPTHMMWSNPDFFTKGGLLYQLSQLDYTLKATPDRSWAVALDPFYYHMEPLLLTLGGHQVAEVPVVQSSTGPVDGWRGMGYDEKSLGRLILVPRPAPGVIEALIKKLTLPFVVEELTPPHSLGSRVAVQQTPFWTAPNRAAEENYWQHPESWRVGKRLTFGLPDAWFWCASGSFSGPLTPPYRLRAHWTLKAPEAGLYRLGASSNLPITIKVDGKLAFHWAPFAEAKDKDLRKGYLGEPFALSGRPQRLDIEQLSVSASGIYDQVLRMVWQHPDGTFETVPLSALKP